MFPNRLGNSLKSLNGGSSIRGSHLDDVRRCAQRMSRESCSTLPVAWVTLPNERLPLHWSNCQALHAKAWGPSRI